MHRDTVTRYIRKAGDHARAAYDELVALSLRTTEVQFEEKWSFVAKKEAHCDRSDPTDDHKGDHWDGLPHEWRAQVTCSPQTGPSGMRVILALQGRRTFDEAHPPLA